MDRPPPKSGTLRPKFKIKHSAKEIQNMAEFLYNKHNPIIQRPLKERIRDLICLKMKK